MADGVIHPLLRATLDGLYGASNIDKLDAAIAVDRAAVAALSPDCGMPAVNDNSFADEFLIEIDAAEAERFRREIARDAAIGDDDA